MDVPMISTLQAACSLMNSSAAAAKCLVTQRGRSSMISRNVLELLNCWEARWTYL